jgi:hypothetical protein
MDNSFVHSCSRQQAEWVSTETLLEANKTYLVIPITLPASGTSRDLLFVARSPHSLTIQQTTSPINLLARAFIVRFLVYFFFCIIQAIYCAPHPIFILFFWQKRAEQYGTHHRLQAQFSVITHENDGGVVLIAMNENCTATFQVSVSCSQSVGVTFSR